MDPKLIRSLYAAGVLGVTRHLYFTEPSKWQVVEERRDASSDAYEQFVWGLRYVDDVVLRDRDTTGNGTLDERLYGLQDANWNVTSISDTGGTIQERYAYTAYGVTVKRILIAGGRWGKAGLAAEGRSTAVERERESQADGFSFVDRLSWDNYNESLDLVGQIETFHEQFGFYPASMHADKIYRTRANRKYCKRRGIRLSGPPLDRRCPLHAPRINLPLCLWRTKSASPKYGFYFGTVPKYRNPRLHPSGFGRVQINLGSTG